MRVAAGFPRVLGVREQGAADPVQPRFRVGKRAFHLVVDNPADCQGSGWMGAVGRRQVMSFPLERLLGQQRMKHRIEIYLGQVEQVGFDVAGDRVVGPVPAGHRVDERRHAHLHHLEKRIANGEFFRPAEHGMLENMRHSRVIRRRGGKRNRKQVLRVLRRVQMNQPRPGRVMRQLNRLAAQGRQRGDVLDGKPVPAGAGRERGGGLFLTRGDHLETVLCQKIRQTQCRDRQIL